LRDGYACGFFNLFIEINKAPAELAGQARAYRAFARAHETRQAQQENMGLRVPNDVRWIHNSGERELIALQNSDCTTVGREFDFRESLTNGADQAVARLGAGVLALVGIRLYEFGSLIVHVSEKRVGIQIKGVVAGEVHLYNPAAAIHGVKARPDEIAVIKNIAGRGHQVDAAQRGLQNLRTATDGVEIELAGALGADQVTRGSFYDDVTGNFLEVHIARDALQLHITVDLLHVDQAGLCLELEFRFFGNKHLEIGFDIMRLCGLCQRAGADINPVADLLDINRDFARSHIAGNHDFPVFPGFHFDAPVDDVLQDYQRAPLDGEMAFLVVGLAGPGWRRGTKKESRAKKGQNAALNYLSLHH